MSFDVGSAIGGITKFVGGFLDRQHAESQQEHGFNLQAGLQREMFDKNAALQREFAQQGIRWKVEDAKAAGLHPAFAIGAPAISASPVSVGGVSVSEVPGIGSALGDMGQDIGRAVNATRSASERDDAYMTTIKALSLRRGELQNELLAAQVAKLKASQNPPLPTPADEAKQAIAGQPATLGAKDPEDTTSLVEGGRRWPINPGFSDAQEVENRYGDVAENIGGAVNLGADIYHGIRNHPYTSELARYLEWLRGRSSSHSFDQRWRGRGNRGFERR